jgi:hypothetical protein
MSALAGSVRILFLNLENSVDFEKESQNYLLRLPLLDCGLPIEHRDFSHQRILKTKGRRAAEEEALTIVRTFRPHLVVYAHTWLYGDLSPDFFSAARAKGAKIVSCIWDSYTVPAHGELQLFQLSDCLLVADSLNAYLRWRMLSAMVGGPAVGLCMGMYHFPPEPAEPKRRDVTILGSVFGERLALAHFLRDGLSKHGLELYTTGGIYSDGEEALAYRALWLDWEDYGRVIRESRICLNSQTARERMQIKGKVFEIVGRGTLCLSDANRESARMFPSDVFPLYGSHAECLELVLHYLRDEPARLAKEQEMTSWMKRNFDSRDFYSGLVRAVAFGEGAVPAHAFLDREFDILMNRRRDMSAAFVDVVAAAIESLSRDGSFPNATPMS